MKKLRRTPDIEELIIFAAKKHQGQHDKAGEPYILHPLRLMLKFGTKDERIVALLHDILEDTNTQTGDLVRLGLSQKVIRAIDSLTRQDGENYQEFIKRAQRNKIAREVKLADIRDNFNPKRITKLPKNVQERLKKKYQAALKEMARK